LRRLLSRPVAGAGSRFGLPAGHPAVLIATVLGIGLVPIAPGSWAALGAVVLGRAVRTVSGVPGLAVAAALVFVAGWWAAGAVVKASGLRDPVCIVVDEIAGQLVVLLAAAPTLAGSILAFLLFRLFDIWKPWPVDWADRRLTGGFGIMLDDLLAAGYALFALWLARKIGVVLG
jgi:phosphatidylglycerophosphatase A